VTTAFLKRGYSAWRRYRPVLSSGNEHSPAALSGGAGEPRLLRRHAHRGPRDHGPVESVTVTRIAAVNRWANTGVASRSKPSPNTARVVAVTTPELAPRHGTGRERRCAPYARGAAGVKTAFQPIATSRGRPQRHLARTRSVISKLLGGFSPSPRVWSISWITMASAREGLWIWVRANRPLRAPTPMGQT